MTQPSPASRTRTTFSIGDEVYELIYSGRMLYRVSKYIGDSGMLRDLNFHTLPEKVKRKVLELITEDEQ